MTVLIVEDDESMRALLGDITRRLGHEVLEAGDGDEAWRIIRETKPAVVVSDWVLPGADGTELCRRLRAEPNGRYTYFIIVTGRRMFHEDYLGAMGSGADDYLRKPLDAEQLAIRLRVADRIVSSRRTKKA